MYRVPEEPGQRIRLSPPGFGPEIDLHAISEWLGANLAVLTAPDWREQRVGQRFSDTSAGGNSGTAPESTAERPVFVTMRYTLADGSVVDVSTRRIYDGSTAPLDHVWETVGSYQYFSAHAAGLRWPDNLPPADAQARLSRHGRPASTGTKSVLVDGSEFSWEQITDTALGTDEDIIACGGRVGESLVAIVGPRQALEDIAVQVSPKP